MTQPELIEDGPQRADELLEESWSQRDRPVRGRELRLELLLTAAFLAAVGALATLAPPAVGLDPLVALVVVAYALAARVEFPVGAGHVVPTQLFLLPLFALAPAQYVPGLVFAGLLLSAAGAVATRRTRADRVVYCGGDALHSLGPALVLVLLADGRLGGASIAVLVLAFAAQLAFDFTSSALHDLVVFSTRPSLHLHVLLNVWSIDAALTSVGLLTAHVAEKTAWAALAPLPFVALLAAMAVDRSRRVGEAHDRLRDLERERQRLQAAVRNIGDAFASNLDLDAVLRIVARAALEALDGEAARATVLRAGQPARQLSIQELPGAEDVLAAAETAVLARAAPALSDEPGALHAVGGAIGGTEPIGLVVVARHRPFSADEQRVLTDLCEQATVSAANAVRHERLLAGEAQLRRQAFRDPLTGLANRACFSDRIEHALLRHRRGAPGGAVLFIDLDGFKVVNDSLGHGAGDELLVEVGRRIAGCMRAGDTAARFGGDEFAVLLEGPDATARADEIAERIRRVLAEPAQVHGRTFAIRGSVGLARSTPALDHEAMLRHADLAMYAAKQDGGDRVVVFQPDMLTRADSRLELAHDLRGAARRGELSLRFQPIVALGAGTIRGVEALVRWEHPRRGLLAPDLFIAIAEETGRIVELGRFVLDEACRAAAAWRPLSGAPPSVSVNVSAAQLRDARFGADVHAALERHGLPATRLVVEVTESGLVEADAPTLANLEDLRATGVAIALDDFGTGYSSLSYLAQFPVDVLKLDRSFVAGIDERPTQARLVGGVLELGRSLGVRVVAEGIERPAQLAALQDLRADLGQGYLLGAPMTAEAIAARVTAGSAALSTAA